MLWASNRDFGNPDILLMGHIDVVAGKKSQFVPLIRGDRLSGRGAFDMKGPLAAMVVVLTQLDTKKRVQLLVTSDEEIGGKNGAEWFFNQTKLKPKVAIVPDGQDNKTIILKQKGPMHLQVEMVGKSAHGSRPWQGRNPVETFRGLMDRIEAMEVQATNKAQWRPTFTPTKVKAEASVNQLASKLEFVLDVRVTHPDQVTRLKRIISQEGGRVIKAFGDGKVFLQEKNGAIRKWIEINREVTGKSLRAAFSAAASDARHLPKETSAIVTQVEGGGAHGDSEWVSIASMKEMAEVISRFSCS